MLCELLEQSILLQERLSAHCTLAMAEEHVAGGIFESKI